MSVNPMADALEPCRVPAPKGFRFARKAAKRCYELAARFVLDHEDAQLVHGLVTNGGSCYAHAWAERDGVVYDGTCKGFYEREGYYAVTKARPVRRFSVNEASKLICELGCYGPCSELVRAEGQAARGAAVIEHVERREEEP